MTNDLSEGERLTHFRGERDRCLGPLQRALGSAGTGPSGAADNQRAHHSS